MHWSEDYPDGPEYEIAYGYIRQHCIEVSGQIRVINIQDAKVIIELIKQFSERFDFGRGPTENDFRKGIFYNGEMIIL